MTDDFAYASSDMHTHSPQHSDAAIGLYEDYI